MTVLFGDVDSFLEDLEKDLDHVERKIVRCAYLRQPIAKVYERVSVAATARVAGEIIRMEIAIGDRMPNGPEDVNREVESLAEATVERVEKFCAANELEVRGGMLE